MKSKFFEKIKLINLYSNSSINKRLQINKTRKEKLQPISQKQNHKRLVWTIICQQLNNLEEMDKSLKTKKSSKTQSWSNRKSITVIKKKKNNSQKTKVQGQKPSQGNSTKHFKKKLTPILLKLFQKIEEEHFQTHPIRPALPWYQNQEERKIDNYRPIYLITKDANRSSKT